jgi:late competence protein required for DNA uptake (superfamily II DNA/RNA helicase)
MKILIFNNENIYPPIFLKTFIIKKCKLNDLQLSAFEGLIKINSTNQLLQYIWGVTCTGKTQIIKTIREYFLETNNEDKLCIITYTTDVIFIGRWNNYPFFI